jgi:hypothetical protein
MPNPAAPFNSRARARFAPPLRWAGVCLLVTLALSACHDASGDPVAAIVAEETAPAVSFDAALPALPVLASTTGLEEELRGPLADWTESWEGLGDRAARDAALEEAVPVLAEVLGQGGVSATLRPVLDAARALNEVDEVPPGLAPAIDEVRLTVRASEAALRTGRLDHALRDGLMAADRLREIGPESVARVLVARAEDLLARAVEPDGRADRIDQDRAEGLLTRARRALDDGEFTLALQRAYYAVRILEPGEG